MGTTRIKIIDLASDQKEIKTSRKHAEKLSAVSYIKKVKPQKKKKQKEEIQKQTVRTPADVLADSDKPKQIEKTDDVKKDLPEIEAQKNTSKKESQKHRHLGKKYNQAASLIDKNKLYNIKEAIDLLHKTSYVKFDPTVEIHLNVKDKNIKGSVNLPHPVAQKKQRQYLVFVDKKIESDEDIILGNEATITQIQEGKLKPNRDFDVVYSTPKYMVQIASIAKILGPAGMMPNPKNKTVDENPSQIINAISESSFEYKTEPSAPIIHSILGKLSQKPQILEDNFATLIKTIGTAKIINATINSTMSPAIKLQVTA